MNGKVYTTIAPGHFLTFLKKRKSYKKNRVITSLIIKFIRKLLIITKINSFNLILKKSPYLLTEILNRLTKPLSHPFLNPFTGLYVDETLKVENHFNINFILFKKINKFAKQKEKKKGRIKRKILRQIVRKNKILD